MAVTLRPSVAADLAALGIEKLPHRIKALTAIDAEGRPIGIGGLVFMPDGMAWATLRIARDVANDTRRRHAVTLMRAARAVLADAQRQGLRTLYAKADPSIEGSGRFLARLGFRPIGGDVWVREG